MFSRIFNLLKGRKSMSNSIIINGVRFTNNGTGGEKNNINIFLGSKENPGERVTWEEVDGKVEITINGSIEGIDLGIGDIKVLGNAGKIDTASGNVEVRGDADNISTVSGDISCSDVSGSAHTVSGDIKAAQIHGSASSISGDIKTK